MEQYVGIQKDPFSLSIRMRIWTSEYRGGIGISEICDDANAEIYLPYQDDHDFSRIVEIFTDIFMKQGIKKLEDISEPSPYVMPSEENNYRLFTEHEELSVQFKKQFCIKKKMDLKQAVDIICKVIEDNSSKEYNAEAEELLLQATAFYGESIKSIYEGDWWWDGNLKVCTLVYYNSNKEKKCACSLKWIFYCWQINDASYFREEYEEIIRD